MDEYVTDENESGDNDLSDLLTELRVLLLGAQLFTTFLMTLPFSTGFRQIVQSEKWTFLATFICSVLSLTLLTAPAVQHRIMRPLQDRARFKHLASGQILFGAAALSGALVLGVDLVIAEVFGHLLGVIVAATVATLIIVMWWVLPLIIKKRLSGSTARDILKEIQ